MSGCGSQGSDSLSLPFPLSTQISLEVNSQEQSLELRTRGQDGDFVSCIFSVPQLFDLRWHKLVLSVAERVASVHVDCMSASSQPLGPRRSIQPVGHVFLGLDAEQGKPVSVSARSGLDSAPTFWQPEWAPRTCISPRLRTPLCFPIDLQE